MWALPLFAQDQPTDSSMDKVRDALKANKRAFVSVNLGLTEQEDKSFWPVYDSYQADMEKVNKRLVDLIKDYAAHYDNLSDEKAKQLLDESLATDTEMMKVKKAYVSKFAAVIPMKKVARYYQMENKIQAVLRFDLAQAIPLVK
jgi:hypothetical protein